MDFTGGQMVLTLKLISMAVCFQDAHSKDPKEVCEGVVCVEGAGLRCVCVLGVFGGRG